MDIQPFHAWRPKEEHEHRVAASPYDVVSSKEARNIADDNPHCFLHVTRADFDLPANIEPYSEEVYLRGRDNLERLKREHVLERDAEPTLYLYSQSDETHEQDGLVAACHVSDYVEGRIRIHEKTRAAKEADRVRCIDTQNAQTGPVFLAYRGRDELNRRAAELKTREPIFTLETPEGVTHRAWAIPDPDAWVGVFADIPEVFVADGHHRAAAASAVAARRLEARGGEQLFASDQYMMAVLFPAEQLCILPYNRIVRRLPADSTAFLDKLKEVCAIEPLDAHRDPEHGRFLCYIDGTWHRLTPRAEAPEDDPVARLDVSRLQDAILAPLLGVEDPRTDENIDFVGGKGSPEKIEAMVDGGEAALGFSLHPTTMDDLMAVAEAGKLMPPKSTWFEPKLLSGLFVHTLED